VTSIDNNTVSSQNGKEKYKEMILIVHKQL